MKKSPLHRYKRINPISDKQKEINRLWGEVTDQKAKDLGYICQWCKKLGRRDTDNPYFLLDGHHIKKRRYGIHTYKNCYIVHRLPCHSFADRYVKEERNDTEE